MSFDPNASPPFNWRGFVPAVIYGSLLGGVLGLALIFAIALAWSPS